MTDPASLLARRVGGKGEPSPALVLEESHPPAEGPPLCAPRPHFGPVATSILVKGSGSGGGRGQHLQLILEKVWEGDFVFTH